MLEMIGTPNLRVRAMPAMRARGAVLRNQIHPLNVATKAWRILAAVAACLILGGCAEIGGQLGAAMQAGYTGAGIQPNGPQFDDPQKATEYWGKEYAKSPRDLDSAISYAQSLKATGQKTQALAVFQQASLIHGGDRRLASEYGRLALELDQVSVAKRLLEAADDPANPDWRVVLARGTALAKEAKYQEAIPYFERALALKPDHPSVMSNLALAYTMTGEAAKGEELLRRAAAADGASAKVRQNLALVQGLQAKHDEATRPAAQPQETAPANAEPPAAPAITAVDVAQAWETDVVETPPPPRRRLTFKRTAANTLSCLRQGGPC